MTDGEFRGRMLAIILYVLAMAVGIGAIARTDWAKVPPVDCSGCPPNAEACLCEVATPEPPLVERRGWFPCTLSSGVKAQCLVGGSTDGLPIPKVDYQASSGPPFSSAPDFTFTWGFRPSSGDFGFGLGYPGYVIMPMGGD